MEEQLNLDVQTPLTKRQAIYARKYGAEALTRMKALGAKMY